MKDPYREDVASHSGPEPHGGCGNTMADAWLGGSVGGALSSEITSFGCRPCGLVGKAISTIALIASYGRTWRSLSTLACVDASCAGIERSGKPPAFISWNGRIQPLKISWCIEGGLASVQVRGRKTGRKCRVGRKRRKPYVRLIMLLGSRTQHSTEEAGEQEDMSTSAEPVEGRT